MTTLDYAYPDLLRKPKKRAQRFSPWAIGAILTVLTVIAVMVAFDPSTLLIAACIYGLLVIALASFAPHYAFMLMFATAPFAWDVGAGGLPVIMAASEITLALSLPFLLIRTTAQGWQRLKSPLWIPVFAYLAVCLGSTVANNRIAESSTAFIQMVIYLVVCQLVFSVCLANHNAVYPAFYGLLASGCFLALMVPIRGALGVFGLHKNLVGTELMYSVIIAFELWLAKAVQKVPRKLNLAILCLLVVGLVFTVSRGAWMGAFCGIMTILLLRRRFGLALKALALLIPIIAVGWFFLPEAARDYATNIDPTNGTSSAGTRVVSIEWALNYFNESSMSHIYGVGVWLRKNADATNVVIYTLAETGVVGLFAFLSIFGTIFFMAWSAQKRIPRTDPVFSLLVIGTSVMFGKFFHGCVDHYWSRGIIPVWAGTGLVGYAWWCSRKLAPNRPKRKRKQIFPALIDVPATVQPTPAELVK